MTDRIPFLDLRVTDLVERQALLDAVARVLDHGRIVLGPEVAEFEEALSKRLGGSHVVGVNSGTDALLLGLKALGIGPGDEVILPPLSFVASANTVTLAGATPVFADIGNDLLLDPDTIEPLISPATKAVMAVHWAGHPCDMDRVMSIARRHGLKVIEDTAQAFGSTYNGRSTGTVGDVGTFSMNCMKVLASLGEAGAVATADAALAERIAVLRYHGLVNRETCVSVSHNGRLDTVQAAMLLVRLARLDEVIARRRANATLYDQRLSGMVETPTTRVGSTHVYYTYTIQTDCRDALKTYLEVAGVEVKIQHLPLMPDQPVYQGKVRAHYPNAARLLSRTLCLPVHEKLELGQIERVAGLVRTFFGVKG